MAISRRQLIVGTALITLGAPPSGSQAPVTKAEPISPERATPTHTALRTQFAGRFAGDFEQMLARRHIRMIVPYSRTLFFRSKGDIYGVAAAGAQLLENWIHKTYALGARPLTVTLTPVSRDKLFDTLLAGAGDIAAGDITITEARRTKVAFTTPTLSNVREIIVTGSDVPELDSAEALSGKEVATRRSTSYFESLSKLNERLAAQGKAPVTVTLVPETLEDEDLMEMTRGWAATSNCG
jgi:ABC-type amino acid transport substrate-binding protein